MQCQLCYLDLSSLFSNGASPTRYGAEGFCHSTCLLISKCPKDTSVASVGAVVSRKPHDLSRDCTLASCVVLGVFFLPGLPVW